MTPDCDCKDTPTVACLPNTEAKVATSIPSAQLYHLLLIIRAIHLVSKMNRLFGAKATGPKPTLDGAINTVSHRDNREEWRMI